jgi:putative FmdB family regulatory protein
MPMYDFKCNSCGVTFDKLVSFSSIEQGVECPDCKEKNTEKLLCAPNVSVNSSGGIEISGCASATGFS